MSDRDFIAWLRQRRELGLRLFKLAWINGWVTGVAMCQHEPPPDTGPPPLAVGEEAWLMAAEPSFTAQWDRLMDALEHTSGGNGKVDA